MIQIKEYFDTDGRNRYDEWFQGLDAHAAAKATTALIRMEQGNFSNVKGVGSGIFEYRIDFGRAIESISGKTEMNGSSCLAAERNTVSDGISQPPKIYGESTKSAKRGRIRWS